MKKIFYFFAAVLVAASLTIGVCADEAAEDATAVETVEETAETVIDGETETAAEIVSQLADEMAELLGASTPEQVETVKQYLLYGLSTLPLSERVKLAILDYIDVAAWVLVIITFILMGLLYLRSNKKTADENKTMTDNAIEFFDEGVKRSETAANTVEEAETRIQNITETAASSMEVLTTNADNIFREASADMIHKIDKLADGVRQTLEAVTTRDEAITEALMAMDKTLVWLINFSDLPEVERDSVLSAHNAAKDRIKEVMGDDTGKD